MKRHVGLILLAAVSLTGCSAFGVEPSPTTTYTDSQGDEITVDWADYPAHAGQNGEALLGRPDQTALEPEARALIGNLQAAIADASGLEMTSTEPEDEWFSDERWFPQLGNGYGGESMLISVNCCESATDGVPRPAKWQAVLDAASEVTRAAGLGLLVLEQDSKAMNADPNWQKEYRDRYCNREGGECWLWNARVYDGVQWVDVSIQDAALDPTGAAATWAENADGRLDNIRVSYGATVVRSGESEEYARAIEPFLGLALPVSTTSD
ncbi:hypothetical protein [Cryobacterium cryoconiti]|uniref:Lipoprotein n=1 Tax=Cryobacterium cryoconiti TaxID=1259239 RepID=A0A4Y8JZ04_9MICO|nr:hypothetical protein [Cryobacterium cryoconiti]TFD28360.1 hypothetical protein E3T49_11850 [Cryobacterium cryoconiti]